MSEKKQIDYYRTRSQFYDTVQNRDNRNHLNKLKAIYNHLDVKPGSKILEIGVGTGIHAMYILKWLKNKKVEFSGIDISPDMLKIAKERLDRFQGISLKQMNAEKLDFPDEHFDGIYMAATLHHLDDCERGIDEVIRCLKPGGKFSLMEPNLYFPKNLYQGLFIPAEKNQMMITKNNFRKWFAKHPKVKYEMVNMAYTPPFPKSFLPLFDKIDAKFAKTPMIKNLSIQLYVKGIKK